MATADNHSASLRLNGTGFKALHKAILDAFSLSELEQLVFFTLDESLNNVVRSPANNPEKVYDLLGWSESKGLTAALVDSMLKENPCNPALKRVALELFPNLSSQNVVGDPLQKLVIANPDVFSDPEGFRQGMLQSEWAICRLEKPSGIPCGTGFLVAPDLILTNHHVKDVPYGHFAEEPDKVRARFDFRENGDEDSAVCKLAEDWLVHESSTTELDYAVIRLDRPIGKEPIGQFQNAPKRGWLSLKPVDLSQGQALFVLQHPKGDTLKMANGGLRAINAPWIEYQVNTEDGSSGSPVFDNQWRVVALHSRFGVDEVNKGVLMSAILENYDGAVPIISL